MPSRRLPALMTLGLVLGLLAMPLAFAAEETLILEDPAAVALAGEVSDRIDALSAKVMACIDANGGDHEPCICVDACSCPFGDAYRAAEAAFHDALAQHPEWRDRMIHFTRPGDAMGYNLAFDGLARQFAAACREAN